MNYHIFEFLRDYKPLDNNFYVERCPKDLSLDKYLNDTIERVLFEKLNLEFVGGDKWENLYL